MPITCTYGDIDRLRDQVPGHTGPLTRLRTSTDVPSLVDRARIMRFTRSVIAEVVEYEKVLIELLKKFGKPLDATGKRFAVDPAFQTEYDAEKAKLDSSPCEVATSKLPAAAYEKVALSVLDLEALEKFVEIPD